MTRWLCATSVGMEGDVMVMKVTLDMRGSNEGFYSMKRRLAKGYVTKSKEIMSP